MANFVEGDVVRVVSQPANQSFVRLVGEVGVLTEIDKDREYGMLETFPSDGPCGGAGWVTLASLAHEHDPVFAEKKRAKDAAKEKWLREAQAFSDRIHGIEKTLAEKHGIPIEAVKDIYNTLANAYP